MFCGNCGTALTENETVCPNCKTPVVGESPSKETETASAYVYSDTEEIKSKINTTGLLVWSIIELICCNQIFGIIALVLYCTSLQNEIKAGNLQGAMKMKKTITWVLIGGLCLTVLIFLLGFAFNIVMSIIAAL